MMKVSLNNTKDLVCLRIENENDANRASSVVWTSLQSEGWDVVERKTAYRSFVRIVTKQGVVAFAKS